MWRSFTPDVRIRGDYCSYQNKWSPERVYASNQATSELDPKLPEEPSLCFLHLKVQTAVWAPPTASVLQFQYIASKAVCDGVWDISTASTFINNLYFPLFYFVGRNPPDRCRQFKKKPAVKLKNNPNSSKFTFEVGISAEGTAADLKNLTSFISSSTWSNKSPVWTIDMIIDHQNVRLGL